MAQPVKQATLRKVGVKALPALGPRMVYVLDKIPDVASEVPEQPDDAIPVLAELPVAPPNSPVAPVPTIVEPKKKHHIGSLGPQVDDKGLVELRALCTLLKAQPNEIMTQNEIELRMLRAFRIQLNVDSKIASDRLLKKLSAK